jgi:hypothetical protein
VFRIRFLILLLITFAVFTTPDALAKPRDAEAWVALNVAPALVRELSTHPRFKGETIRIVVFDNDKPAAESSAFALSLRDRLAHAIFDTPGIRMAADRSPGERIDCTLNDVDYYIGLQIAYLGSDEYRIDLRTLDIADQSWVTGFDLTWQGQLTQTQLNELKQDAPDPWFRGARAAPFEETQADVLAADIAHSLACESLRQTAGEYVVLMVHDKDDPLMRATELVRNNLAAFASVRFTDDPASANAVLAGQSHGVATGLSQYWVTIAPIESASGLPTLSANAYVRVAEPIIDPFESLLGSKIALSPASITEISGKGVVMQVQTKQDAVVFFLNHQQRYGLVRLSNRECRSQPDARVLRSDTTINRVLPIAAVNPDATSSADDWTLEPAGDRYYAIAVTDSAAAHVIARHIQKLPQRCTQAARFGLRDTALETWLTDFAAIVQSQGEYVDWQAVQVRNVY